MFDTDTGVSTLLLKEVPYKQIAYVKVQSVQPGGLADHLKECIGFCRMCGAERILATGHPELERYPLHCRVNTMAMAIPDGELPAMVFPVTEATVGQWRQIYNEKMASVHNAATMTAFDEKKILASGGAVFVHEDGALLGIGWVDGSEILCVAAVQPGAGERIMLTLMTLLDGDRAELEVASTNSRAIRLYERLGFVTVGERSSWYQIL